MSTSPSIHSYLCLHAKDKVHNMQKLADRNRIMSSLRGLLGLAVARVIARVFHQGLQRRPVRVFGVELRWLNVEVFAKVHELTLAATVVHERQGSTSAAKATPNVHTQIGWVGVTSAPRVSLAGLSVMRIGAG